MNSARIANSNTVYNSCSEMLWCLLVFHVVKNDGLHLNVAIYKLSSSCCFNFNQLQLASFASGSSVSDYSASAPSGYSCLSSIWLQLTQLHLATVVPAPSGYGCLSFIWLKLPQFHLTSVCFYQPFCCNLVVLIHNQHHINTFIDNIWSRLPTSDNLKFMSK